MSKKLTRQSRRRKIHRRVRFKIRGTPERPRLCVYRSLSHTYAQIIDDIQGKTLISASTLNLDGGKLKYGGNLEGARRVGRTVAEKAKTAGIEAVIFDRGGYIYHGRVKALAEAAREAGLKF